MKRTIIVFAILMLFCSSAITDEPWIKDSKALKIMEKHIKKQFDKFEQIGGIQFVYPYGYGIPDYIGYFEVSRKHNKSIITVRVNALTKEVSLIKYGGIDYTKLGFELPFFSNGALKMTDQIRETLYGMLSQFLDTNFVRDKVEELSGKRVKMMHLVSCGGDYYYLDCLDIAQVFWLIHLIDDEEHFFYFALNKWVFLPVYKQKQEHMKNY